tara:strand:- start:130 stop:384 length:255 start_codon:yes stop_codon:yes gene_type:complete
MNDQLIEIKTSIQDLTNKIDRHIDTCAIHQANMSEMLHDHKRILYGEKGLLTRMTKMETTNKIWFGGIITSIGAIASKLFLGKE